MRPTRIGPFRIRPDDVVCLSRPVSSAVRNTVLHYTGSRRDHTGVHAAIRELAQTGLYRSLLGAGPDFVAEKEPRLRVWRGPRVADEMIGPGNLWPTLVVAWRVRRWLDAGANRIFHGHSRAGLLVGLWLRLLGARRVAVSVHCYGRQRWFYRLAHTCLGARLIWLSPAMKRHYGLPADTWTGCMPNGLARAWAPAFRRWPGDRPLRLGGAGMLVRWKRWDLVLAALARLPRGCEVEFVHIGGPVDHADSRAYERELHALAADPRLAGRVHWLGWQPSSAALLQQVDAVVVPSDGEPFSMIALEALFAGVPVIATRGGGPDDFIVEGRNGWLVPSGDAGALADRLARCCEPAAWQSLCQEPGHIGRFSMTGTLAARWAEIYGGL